MVGGAAILACLISPGHTGLLPYLLHGVLIPALRGGLNGHVAAAHNATGQRTGAEVQRNVLDRLAHDLLLCFLIAHAARHIYGDPLLHVGHTAVDHLIPPQIGKVGEHLLASLDTALNGGIFQHSGQLLLCRARGQFHVDQAFQTYLLKEAFHHARRHTGDNSVAIVQTAILCGHHRVGGRRAAQCGRSGSRRNAQRRQCHRGRAVQHRRTHTIRKRGHIAVVILEVFRHLAPHTAGVGIGQHGRGVIVRRRVGVGQFSQRRVDSAYTTQKVSRDGQQRAANRRLLALIPRHLLHLGIPLRILLPFGDIAIVIHQLRKLILREPGRQQRIPRGLFPFGGGMCGSSRNTLCVCQHLQCGGLILRQIVQRLAALDVILDALGFVQVGLHGGIVLLCFRLLRVIGTKGVDIIRLLTLLCLFPGLFYLCAVVVQIKPRQPPVLLDIRLLLGLFVRQFLGGFLPIPRKGESAQKRTAGRYDPPLLLGLRIRLPLFFRERNALYGGAIPFSSCPPPVTFFNALLQICARCIIISRHITASPLVTLLDPLLQKTACHIALRYFRRL